MRALAQESPMAFKRGWHYFISKWRRLDLMTSSLLEIVHELHSHSP